MQKGLKCDACTARGRAWQRAAFLRGMHTALELEQGERKILLDWLELELVAGVVWEENIVELELKLTAEHSEQRFSISTSLTPEPKQAGTAFLSDVC